MENCNLILGILIISAMLYIIILNNPTKEHYRKSNKKSISNSLAHSFGRGVSKGIFKSATKCVIPLKVVTGREANILWKLPYDKPDGAPCSYSDQCKSLYCRSRTCRQCIN
jgi:hypothetical protein